MLLSLFLLYLFNIKRTNEAFSQYKYQYQYDYQTDPDQYTNNDMHYGNSVYTA